MNLAFILEDADKESSECASVGVVCKWDNYCPSLEGLIKKIENLNTRDEFTDRYDCPTDFKVRVELDVVDGNLCSKLVVDNYPKNSIVILAKEFLASYDIEGTLATPSAISKMITYLEFDPFDSWWGVFNN